MEKENVPKARPGIRVENLVKGTKEAVRKHRCVSLFCYSIFSFFPCLCIGSRQGLFKFLNKLPFLLNFKP